ncbi:FG-GAP-like repeat-containing protein, partial [Micromonospora sp. URMC 105]|uniref:FG-GAP-like repeat-containing protein n=1 Tax=Micromonospora sp. URMC 105 TaxID=3423413 RepID=UPI003F1A0DF5
WSRVRLRDHTVAQVVVGGVVGGLVADAGYTTLAYSTAPCSSVGTTAGDAALAATLNTRLSAKMDGYMDAYRVSCARKVVQAVQARGLHPRAATIAVTTTIVETGIRNIDEMVDHDSLGLFQQRASWGTASQRLDPTWATNAFLNSMLRKFPDNSWMTTQIGVVCQTVQVSAYPDRYQPEAGDAQIIVDALWGSNDFDGDGDADVLARNASTKDVHLYKGNGSGGFTSGTGAAISNNWSAFDIVVNAGDFDGDGDADVLARNASTKDLHLYRGNGSGGFASGTGAAISNNWSAFDMIFPAGDFDGDGDSDVLARNASTKDLWLYKGSGSGGFSAGAGAISNNWSAFDRIFSVGDFDGDGDPDVLARNASTKNLHLYKGNGSGGFTSGTGAAISNNWSTFDMIFSVGDFDGDGDGDVLARNASTKDLHLYKGNGSGGFTSGTGAAISNNWSAFDRLF